MKKVIFLLFIFLLVIGLSYGFYPFNPNNYITIKIELPKYYPNPCYIKSEYKIIDNKIVVKITKRIPKFICLQVLEKYAKVLIPKSELFNKRYILEVYYNGKYYGCKEINIDKSKSIIIVKKSELKQTCIEEVNPSFGFEFKQGKDMLLLGLGLLALLFLAVIFLGGRRR